MSSRYKALVWLWCYFFWIFSFYIPTLVSPPFLLLPLYLHSIPSPIHSSNPVFTVKCWPERLEYSWRQGVCCFVFCFLISDIHFLVYLLLQWLIQMEDTGLCFMLSLWLCVCVCVCMFHLCRIWIWDFIVKYSIVLWCAVFSASADLEFKPDTWVPCFFKILGYVKCCEQFPLSLRKIKDPADQATQSPRLLLQPWCTSEKDYRTV